MWQRNQNDDAPDRIAACFPLPLINNGVDQNTLSAVA
jgi:hypothetical protein